MMKSRTFDFVSSYDPFTKANYTSDDQEDDTLDHGNSNNVSWEKLSICLGIEDRIRIYPLRGMSDIGDAKIAFQKHSGYKHINPK